MLMCSMHYLCNTFIHTFMRICSCSKHGGYSVASEMLDVALLALPILHQKSDSSLDLRMKSKY